MGALCPPPPSPVAPEVMDVGQFRDVGCIGPQASACFICDLQESQVLAATGAFASELGAFKTAFSETSPDKISV